MIGNLNPAPTDPAVADNGQKARAAWGADVPDWVLLLAGACDRLGQRGAAQRLDQSSGTISKVIRRVYAGNYAEIERKVRAAFSPERVLCPATAAHMALKTCLRWRRRTGTPQHALHIVLDDYCPRCPNNTDILEED